jgi:hypothetical protein
MPSARVVPIDPSHQLVASLGEGAEVVLPGTVFLQANSSGRDATRESCDYLQPMRSTSAAAGPNLERHSDTLHRISNSQKPDYCRAKLEPSRR